MPPPPEDEFAALSRALATLRDRDTGAILTDEFLEVCRGVLPVIGESFPREQSAFFSHICSRFSSFFLRTQKTLLQKSLLNATATTFTFSLGHFGAALAAIVRSDVGGNIERLERARRRGKEATSGETAGGGGDSSAPSTSSASASAAAASVNSSDPSFRLLFSIPLDEIERGADLGAKSDAKGLLWLKRANDFILLMLENLLKGTKERGGGGGEGKKKKDASSSSSSSAASPPLSVSAAARAAYNDTLRKYHGMLTAAAFSAALSVRETERTFFLLFLPLFFLPRLSLLFSLTPSSSLAPLPL